MEKLFQYYLFFPILMIAFLLCFCDDIITHVGMKMKIPLVDLIKITHPKIAKWLETCGGSELSKNTMKYSLREYEAQVLRLV